MLIACQSLPLTSTLGLSKVNETSGEEGLLLCWFF